MRCIAYMGLADRVQNQGQYLKIAKSHILTGISLAQQIRVKIRT